MDNYKHILSDGKDAIITDPKEIKVIIWLIEEQRELEKRVLELEIAKIKVRPLPSTLWEQFKNIFK